MTDITIPEPKQWGTYTWDSELSFEDNIAAADAANALVKAEDLQRYEQWLYENLQGFAGLMTTIQSMYSAVGLDELNSEEYELHLSDLISQAISQKTVQSINLIVDGDGIPTGGDATLGDGSKIPINIDSGDVSS